MQSVASEVEQNNRKKGLVLSLAGTALLATNFITAKHGANEETGFGSSSFTVIWTLGCSIWAMTYLLLSGNRTSLRLPVKDLFPVIMLGVCTGAGMIFAWAGLVLMDPSFNAFMWRMMPVMGMLLGVIFLKERLAWMDVLPVMVMLAGGLVGTWGRCEAVGLGLLYTVAGALLFAIQLFIGKLQSGKLDEVALVFYRSFFALIVVTGWTFATGRQHFSVGPSIWFATMLGSFLGPFLGFICMFRSYRYWGLSRSSMVMSVQPLVVLPLAVIVLGAFPEGRELLSGSIILAGAFWLGWVQLNSRNP